MKEIIITTETLADYLVASISMKMKHITTEAEHLSNCSAWRFIFGDEFFTEAIQVAKDKYSELSYDAHDGTITGYDADAGEWFISPNNNQKR